MNYQKIKSYLENNFNFKQISIKELAKKIGVSPSAITRFCKNNGYSGYKEFPILLNEYKKQTSKIANLQNSIKYTSENLDINKINFIAQKIMQANYIYLLGESFTYLQALIFERKLLHLNINAKCLNVASELSLILPKKQAVFLFISHTGKNPNILRAAEKIVFKKEDRPILFAVNALPICNIKHLVNEVVYGHTFFDQDNQRNILPSNALIITQIVLDYIFEAIFSSKLAKHQLLVKKLAVEKK